MEEPFGLVTVTCVQARGLQVPALYGLTRGRRPDCYVELGLGKTPPKKSAIVQGSAEPNWRRQNISFELSLGRLAKELHVRVCDAARDGAVLGSATVDLSPLLSGRETQVDRWLDLVGGGAQQQPKGARVRLALAFDVLVRQRRAPRPRRPRDSNLGARPQGRRRRPTLGALARARGEQRSVPAARRRGATRRRGARRRRAG
ncbi:hypothetical protein M885DRAFT_151268 [Pelagophyceae sp. CCMP2097]|nr:hypothetical protein M885DRAFT_151268 [Pelagophyceae sp. CCMP2097]